MCCAFGVVTYAGAPPDFACSTMASHASRKEQLSTRAWPIPSAGSPLSGTVDSPGARCNLNVSGCRNSTISWPRQGATPHWYGQLFLVPGSRYIPMRFPIWRRHRAPSGGRSSSAAISRIHPTSRLCDSFTARFGLRCSRAGPSYDGRFLAKTQAACASWPRWIRASS